MRVLAALALGAFAVLGHGSALAVTIVVDLERLQDASGSSMAASGLVVLTAATSGNSFGPTPSSFASGDELVLQKWDLAAFSQPGAIQDSVTGLSLGGSWGVGDPLRVYWYPTLTLDSPAPGAGTSYGTYSDLVGVDGSAPWLTPAGGDSISLKFFTTDATFLSVGGSNPSSAGLASFQVVPEPSALAFEVMSLAAVGFVRARRRPAGLKG